MKKIAVLLFVLCSVFTCKREPEETLAETRVKLTKAMVDFLYREGKGRFDSSTVRYQVLDTIIFEEKYAYLCRFNVHVKAPNFDTTGIMSAEISKTDMTKVKRLR